MEVLKSIYRRVRLIIRRAIGLEPNVTPEIAVHTEFVGSTYGGWAVCPQKVEKEDIVLSFGVGRDVSFDVEMIEHFGVQVHAFDPTPRSIEWIETKKIDASFIFHPIGVADFNGTERMYPPEDPEHVSYSTAERRGTPIEADVARLEDICKEVAPNANISILKMDIEGAEYDVIDDMVESTVRPCQLLIEFHHWMPEFDPEDTEAAIRHLRELDYRIAHISESGREYTLLHSTAI
jgi:FkbM family methyltransferase